MPSYLKGRQKFITTGGFDNPRDNPDQRDKAFVCSSGSLFQNILPAEVSSLQSDHEETDSSVWLHALDGPITSVLILSLIHTTLAYLFWEKNSTQSIVINCHLLQTKKNFSI